VSVCTIAGRQDLLVKLKRTGVPKILEAVKQEIIGNYSIIALLPLGNIKANGE
jgi:hypothetical protein